MAPTWKKKLDQSEKEDESVSTSSRHLDGQDAQEVHGDRGPASQGARRPVRRAQVEVDRVINAGEDREAVPRQIHQLPMPRVFQRRVDSPGRPASCG